MIENNRRDDLILNETIDEVETQLGNDIGAITVERAVLGLFFTGVKLSDGSGGVSFTPVKEIPEAVCCPSSAKAMPLSGKLSGRSAREYLNDIGSGNVLKRALGIAMLNALSSSCWNRRQPEGYKIVRGADAFDEIDVGRYRKTAVIGALVPMLKRLVAANCDFKVFEQDPSTLKPREMEFYAPPEDAGKHIPFADLIVITGATLLNGTLAGLLDLAGANAEVVVTGPTASMLPGAFFKRGVTVLGGILVTKPDEILDVIAEGGSGYHFFGKSADRFVIKRPSLQ
ncbi:MAG: DUF364 domain-containing protein [Synergistaceae bacterium]|jgi:uncharacterized protein (DUF4213/DUF364 family)|nr:DUF364 domain-containing protein [Synergistaceae bacterium]